jgi:CBS domain containing-hemolysin-like protein
MTESVWVDLLRLGVVFLLVLANGFFVAAEFSLVSVRRTRIAELAAHGSRPAEAVQEAMENPDRVIAATQLGITLASLGLGWVGEPAVSHLILPLVNLFPAAVQSGISHTISATLAFALITFMHVVVGELAPKSIALQNPENTSMFVARPTIITEKIFKPAIWLLNGAGNLLLKLLRVHPPKEHQSIHSVEELKMLVTASAAGGVVEADEQEMLHAVFDFGSLVVRQVMIPRTEIVAVEADAPLNDIIGLVSESTYTKFPVYDDSLDQILGIVHVKDLLNAVLENDHTRYTARSFVREALFVPDTLSVSALLREFRDRHQHIAIAMDEYSGTSGLVTLEDLLEEIVGEVSDPFDAAEPEFQTQADGSILVDGKTLIEEVNNQLGLDLHDPDYDTVAGYALGKFGRIPAIGDSLEADGIRLQVTEMDGRRIAHLALTRLENPVPAEPSPDQPAS